MGELTNKNDYRYLAALADIKEIGAETPPMLHEDTPRSLGLVTTLPATASTNQWIVWNGGSAGGMIVGDIYMWDGSAWVHKDPTDASAQGMYMASLSDIMSVVPNVAGRFSTVFTNLLMAQEIIVGKTIKSSNFDGVIDADGHVTDSGTSGFAMTHAGEQIMRGIIKSNGIATNHFTINSLSTLREFVQKVILIAHSDNVVIYCTGSFSANHGLCGGSISNALLHRSGDYNYLSFFCPCIRTTDGIMFNVYSEIDDDNNIATLHVGGLRDGSSTGIYAPAIDELRFEVPDDVTTTDFNFEVYF